MEEVVRLLNNLRAGGIISDYAVFGAIAQMRYTEPVATLDADILIALPNAEGLDILSPVYRFCEKQGYHPEGEAIRVGAWPVQFIPAFDNLTREALKNAETGDFNGLPFRVVRADYLAAIAISVGRPKDHARVLALLESEAVTADDISRICAGHGLNESWQRFRKKFLDD